MRQIRLERGNFRVCAAAKEVLGDKLKKVILKKVVFPPSIVLYLYRKGRGLCFQYKAFMTAVR